MVVIRRWWPLAVVVGALVLSLGILLFTDAPPAPLSTRVDSVAKTLRCPTCQGQSVAASETPIARSMRSEIRHQLAAGRTPDQVRAWFGHRYGADIVTVPSSRGPGLLLWLAPLGVLLVGGVVMLVRLRPGGARPEPKPLRPAPGGARALSGGRLLAATATCAVAGVGVALAVPVSTGGDAQGTASAVTARPGTPGPQAWVAVGRTLDRQGDAPGAMSAYRRALSADPRLPSPRVRLAFDLLRADRVREAEGLVRPVAASPGRYRAVALLVLGLAQRRVGDPRATATLHRFLRLAPRHPAAAEVRRLLVK